MYTLLLLLYFFILDVVADPVNIQIHRRSTGRSVHHYSAAADRLRQKYGYSRPPSPPKSKLKRQSTANVAMTNQNSDSSYFAAVNIGTPGQNLNVILDTGSADLWVATTQCRTCSTSTPTFDASKSSSFQQATGAEGEVEIHYGSGAVAGTVSKDVVKMGGFKIDQQIFVGVDQTSDGLLDGTLSGILGLAWEAIANTQSVPFWQGLFLGSQLQSPQMSFAFTRLLDQNNNPGPSEAFGGTFTLGGTNSTFYTGDIEFLDMPNRNSDPSFWLLQIKSLSVGGKPVQTSGGGLSLAAIDTGTTLIGGPTRDVEAFWESVRGSAPVVGLTGFFSFPCTSKLNVTISFGGKSWPINPIDMNLGPVPGGGSEDCVGGIFDLSLGSNLGPGRGPGWVIGDTFLKNVYSVFRAMPPSIGFAQLSNAAGGSPGSPGPPRGTGNPSSTGGPTGGACTSIPLSWLGVTLSLVVLFTTVL